MQCEIDNYHRNYLECKQCKEGYKILNGQCVKDCINNHGLSLNAEKICVACSDKNCVDCSEEKEVCLQCDILTTLQNGSCSSIYCLI